MKGDSNQASIAHNHHEYSSAAKHTPRKRPTNRAHDDDDWEMDTPRRRPTKSFSNSEKKAAAAIETNVNRIIQSVEKETIKEAKDAKEVKVATPKVEIASPTKTPLKNRSSPVKRESDNKKEQQQLQVRDT